MTGLTYKEAGVDIDAGDSLVQAIKPMAQSTARSGADGALGGFGALFDLKAAGFVDPILVSGTDGVGTKLKLAIEADVHDGVGIDCVAMCVNDVIVQGAEPLFFMDYIGIGQLRPDVVRDLIDGLARGCRDIGCALIGGETAELPDLYSAGEYDLAGSIVGVVERSQVITGEGICPGDVVIGLPSVGLHTNGYSLARKIAFEAAALDPRDDVADLGCTIGAELLKPHRSYVKACLDTARSVRVRGLAHITGGGILENSARILPADTRIRIDPATWDRLPVFGWLQSAGGVADFEMYRVFNMGIGMVVVVAPEVETAALERLARHGENGVVIGEVIQGAPGVDIVNIGGSDR
ncbi:phosphoribosylformylglycinamidine cyclo-ligase [Candidatus Poribacteria bacterium]|nr:phosphoribosylformylglycinamidine cyclo-ligase [Candidatus Poribacteria bacterium]